MKKIIAVVALSLLPFVANASDTEEVTIIIKEHKFEPAEVTIPAGKKIKLTVQNEDATPEEFESHDLNREKIIQGNSKGVVVFGPLEAGEYKFFGEFNEDTAQGKFIAE